MTGQKLIDCLLEPGAKWPASLPKIEDRAQAVLVAEELIRASMFHRSEKIKGKKGVLQISQKNVFEAGGYYTWMYSGSMMWSNVATGTMMFLVIGFTLLPVWPDFMKKILWYVICHSLFTKLVA